MAEQKLFDIINDGLPDRYKVKLKDRFFYEDDPFEGLTPAAYLERAREEKKAATSH